MALWPCPRPVSSKYHLKLLASSLWSRPSHWHKEAFVLDVFRWIFSVVKTSIWSKRTAGNITSSSHNSKESQVNYAFGIVRASQLTMADATQSFLQHTLEKGSFTTQFVSLQISSLFQGGFLGTHTLSSKYCFVQKEYLQCLLLTMAEKEHVFESRACRCLRLCSYFSIDWLGDRKPSPLFWASTSLSAEWRVCILHSWVESALLMEENWWKHFIQWERSAKYLKVIHEYLHRDCRGPSIHGLRGWRQKVMVHLNACT